eukprot:2534508-Rhodomonas_salina.1
MASAGSDSAPAPRRLGWPSRSSRMMRAAMMMRCGQTPYHPTRSLINVSSGLGATHPGSSSHVDADRGSLSANYRDTDSYCPTRCASRLRARAVKGPLDSDEATINHHDHRHHHHSGVTPDASLLDGAIVAQAECQCAYAGDSHGADTAHTHT